MGRSNRFSLIIDLGDAPIMGGSSYVLSVHMVICTVSSTVRPKEVRSH
jgi:hypothetical protein